MAPRPLNRESPGSFPCPVCGERAAVINSRPRGDVIVRRRRCASNHRFNTQETVVTAKTGDVAPDPQSPFQQVMWRLTVLLEPMFEGLGR